jgi:Ca2+-binding RTX toxin-like protein
VALAIAPRGGAEVRGTTPCPGNEDATTITQATYSGSNGPDTIQANEKDNVIYGRKGADVICAYTGKDRVYGGSGGDDLYGEDQNDDLYGGRQADVLYAGAGANDLCKGGKPQGGGGSDADKGLDCETLQGAVPP